MKKLYPLSLAALAFLVSESAHSALEDAAGGASGEQSTPIVVSCPTANQFSDISWEKKPDGKDWGTLGENPLFNMIPHWALITPEGQQISPNSVGPSRMSIEKRFILCTYSLNGSDTTLDARLYLGDYACELLQSEDKASCTLSQDKQRENMLRHHK